MKEKKVTGTVRHHPNSRRFTCACGKLHEYWNDYIDEKGRQRPNHKIHCTCGIRHWRF